MALPDYIVVSGAPGAGKPTLAGQLAERERHPGHFDQHRAVDSSLWTGPRSDPIGGPWPMIGVDTNEPVPVELVVGLIASAPD